MLQKQNIRELKAAARRTRTLVGRVLYNALDEGLSFSHDGVPYMLPPDGPSVRRFTERPDISRPGLVEDRGEHAIYDGTLTVFDRYGVERRKAVEHRKALRQGKRPQEPPRDKLLAGAWDIAAHGLRKLGFAGVVMLEGDPVRDAELRKLARETAHNFKREQCERTVGNYHARAAKFTADPRNAGKLMPRMDKRENDAMVWLDEDALGMKSTKRYLCPVDKCGFDNESKEVIDRHIRARHERTHLEMEAARADAEPAKRGPGRPRTRPEAGDEAGPAA
jgi:hypothetical protein